MLTQKKIKEFICSFCNNEFTTRQALSRHINHNKKCLRQRKVTVIDQTTQSEISDLEKQLYLLKNKESVEQKELRLLKEQIQTLTQSNIILKTQLSKTEQDLKLCQPFYQKYMTNDTDNLKYFNPTELNRDFEKYLCDKYEQGKLFLTKHFVYSIHDYFVPKYYTLVSTLKTATGIYKYRNENNQIVIDDKLAKLYKLSKPIYLGVFSSVLGHLRLQNSTEDNTNEITMLEEIYFKLIIDDNLNSFYNRMITIDDVTMTKLRHRDYQHLVDVIEK